MHYGLKHNIQLLFVLNLLLFISCKKEVQSELPTIHINTPLENSIYQIGDKVKVSARITDDERINDVVVWLKNEDHQAVLSRNVHVGRATFDLELEIWLDDASLNGRYYFDVTAYDDQDFASAFRYVNIGGKAKALDKIFIINASSNATTLYELEQVSLKLLNTFNGDFLTSSMDASEPILYSIGNLTGDLNAVDTAGNLLWKSVSDRLPGVPHFNSSFVSDDLVLVSLEKGLIEGFDHKGQKIMQKVLDNGYEAGYVFQHEDKVLYEEIQKKSGQVKLVDLYYPSGLFNKEIVFNHGEIIEIVSISWNKVLFFINGMEGPMILEFDTEKYFFTKLYEDKAGPKFKGVRRMDDNTISIVDEKDMHTYYIDQNILLLFKKEYSPDIIRYDANLKVLWCSKGMELRAFDTKFSSEVYHKMLDKEITSFELFFSRD